MVTPTPLPRLPGLAEPAVQLLRPEVRQFLEIGFDLYLGRNVISGASTRYRGRLPSRDGVVAEARARRMAGLTQARFDTYWKSIQHYREDLAVYARSLLWQERELEETRQLVEQKARSVAAGNGTLGDLVDEISICDIRRRVRLAPAVRLKDGLAGPHECSIGVLDADRWRYEVHERRWGAAYATAARILGIDLPPGFLPEFRRFAAALAEGMAVRAYVEHRRCGTDTDPIETFGLSLGDGIKMFLRARLPGINLDQPWSAGRTEVRHG